MTQVKICGLTEKEHVEAAIEAGADAIGFVFAPSSREVSVASAKELAALIPATILKIGVFVNASKERLHEVYNEVGLDFVQLHGDESPAFIQTIGLPTIKAFSIKGKADVEAARQYEVDYYLFDAPGILYQGGSGVPFDWNLLEGSGIPREKCILAGGLNKDNVQEAIQRVKPAMVDVSSGVEKKKRKEESLIQQFIETVRNEER